MSEAVRRLMAEAVAENLIPAPASLACVTVKLAKGTIADLDRIAELEAALREIASEGCTVAGIGHPDCGECAACVAIAALGEAAPPDMPA